MTTRGTVSGWHYASRQPVQIAWANGVINQITEPSDPPPPDLWIAPALCDLQVNGFAGVDFQQANLTTSDLLLAARGLRAAGCSRFFVTCITDRWTNLMQRLRQFRALRAGSPELQSAIAGWHLEGPFLSSEPGYAGAHAPNLMCDPSEDMIRELRRVTGNDPVLMTIAPERQGAADAIRLAVSLGVIVSLGHTNAPVPALREAIAAGASGFTHLGNACPQQLDRHDNILWRVLDTDELTVSLIPDGMHVSPAFFRLVHRQLGSSRIFYTTDAMAAAGAAPGRYTIGPIQLEVGPDGIVRQPGKSNFAGSALRPLDGVFRAAAMLQRPWQEVWDSFSVRPARFAGLPSGLQPGMPCALCLIRAREDGSFESIETIGGETARDCGLHEHTDQPVG